MPSSLEEWLFEEGGCVVAVVIEAGRKEIPASSDEAAAEADRDDCCFCCGRRRSDRKLLLPANAEPRSRHDDGDQEVDRRIRCWCTDGTFVPRPALLGKHVEFQAKADGSFKNSKDMKRSYRGARRSGGGTRSSFEESSRGGQRANCIAIQLLLEIHTSYGVLF